MYDYAGGSIEIRMTASQCLFPLLNNIVFDTAISEGFVSFISSALRIFQDTRVAQHRAAREKSSAPSKFFHLVTDYLYIVALLFLCYLLSVLTTELISSNS